MKELCVARFFVCLLLAIWPTCSVSNAVEAPALSTPGVARLIIAAEKNVKDSQGWAADLLDVLKLHDLPAVVGADLRAVGFVDDVGALAYCC